MPHRRLKLPLFGTRSAAALVVFLTGPALFPLLRSGYWRSDDGLIHLFRLAALERAVAAGAWYPRLFPEFAFDYGFAVLHYYAPLSYYVGLFFTSLGLNTVNAMKAAFALSLVASAVAMWWLARDVWENEAAGILAAAIYTYLPYHLADVYVRGALAESWAFFWWPLVLWAVWRERWGLCVAGLAGLVLTHNLSALLFAPLFAVWWAIITWERRLPEQPILAYWLSAARKLAVVVVLAAFISAFYWLPVLLETRWVLLAVDVGGRGFTRHLYPWHEWIARTFFYRYFPHQQVAAEHPLSWAHLALLLIIPAAAWKWQHRLPSKKLFWALEGVLVVTLFLLTASSRPLWELIVVPFGMVQYPWRWLGISVCLTALLSGVLVYRMPGRRWQSMFVVGWTITLAASSLPFVPRERLDVPVARMPEVMWEADYAAQQIGATWTAEYLPRWVREERWAVPRPVERPEVGLTAAVERAQLVEVSPWRYVLEVEARAPTELRLHQFYLPAWQARVDGQPAPTWPSTSLGLVTVNVSTGHHRVEINWHPTRAVRVGTWLSLLSLAGWIGWEISQRWRHWSRQERPWLLPTRGIGALVGGIGVIVVLVARMAAPPASFAPASAAVGDLAFLAGWQLEPQSPSSGQSLSVTLYWLSRRPTPVNYKVFVHLTGPDDGAPLAQSDAEAGSGYTPTTRWVAGELVPDRHRLDLTGLPPGEYHLWAGLYDFTTGERLPVAGRTDGRIFLGRVEIRPAEK